MACLSIKTTVIPLHKLRHNPIEINAVKEFLCMWHDEGLGEMLEKDQVLLRFRFRDIRKELDILSCGAIRDEKSASTSFWARKDKNYDSAQRSNPYRA